MRNLGECGSEMGGESWVTSGKCLTSKLGEEPRPERADFMDKVTLY